jgi:hypothetical protein
MIFILSIIILIIINYFLIRFPYSAEFYKEIKYILPIIIALVTFFAGIMWSLRIVYVHEARNADVNMESYALKLEQHIKDKQEIDYNKNMTLQWLYIAEQYRMVAIKLSFISFYLIMRN